MNASANTLVKTLAATMILAVVGVLMLASRPMLSSAALQERTFENRIPAHIPLKIKIKKEKEQSFKDVQNEKWLGEFELEITNTGDKPIYFLNIMLGTNVKVDNGLEMVYPLTYGRAELGDIVTKATIDDVPIKPGETINLQIGEVPAWEKGVREKRWPQSTKFTADFQSLSFGDGTGYFGTKPYPPTGRRQASFHVPMLSSRETSSSAAFQERIFENKIPAHIPIKIRIKKEKEESFRNLKNEKWLREFELEVTNTGDKPIYYIEIVMLTGVKFDGGGQEILFPLQYGRPELGDIVTKATTDDVPIKPRETIILTMRQATAWEIGIREKRWPEATKLEFETQVLSFGDGTGYWGNELYPPPERRKAAPNIQAAVAQSLARAAKRFGKQKSSSNFSQPTFMTLDRRADAERK